MRVWLFGLVRRFDRESSWPAGHIGLFSSRGGHGWCIHTWHQINAGWALHRCWNFVLFAVHHFGEGKAPAEPGWYITLPGRKRCNGCGKSRIYGPDKYSVKEGIKLS